MYRYHGQIISLNTTNNNTRFSEDVIHQILAEQKSVPVLVNFVGDSIGYAYNYRKDEDKLLCTIDIQYPNMDQLNLYLVPRGIIKTDKIYQDEKGVTVIDSMDLLEVSITSSPADQSLSKMEKND